MTQIIDVDVQWNFGWANDPKLIALFDDNPFKIRERLRYENVDNCWYGQEGEFCHYYAHSGSDKNEGGFYGYTSVLNMKDGSVKKLIGPWTGNSAWANSKGFGPCIEALVTDDPEVIVRGHTFLAGSVTLAGAERILSEKRPDVIMIPTVWSPESTEIWHVPYLKDNPCEHPNSDGNMRCGVCNHKIMTQMENGLWIESRQLVS